MGRVTILTHPAEIHSPTTPDQLQAHTALGRLGVTPCADGGEVRVFSAHATEIQLQIFGEADPAWATETTTLSRDDHGVFSGASARLVPGARYGFRVSGPTGPGHLFDPEHVVTDPYSRGIVRVGEGQWRSQVLDEGFDWAGATKPNTPLAQTVIYEAHAKGLTRLHPEVPDRLRGTYAGLAHPATIGHLKSLGVTAIQLLPVQAFISEEHLIVQGLNNYWGYNTLNFFSPHAGWATKKAQEQGPGAILREFKGMVKLMHEAGLEVILDVVYNHTAEAGVNGPRVSFRGLDNATYYRHDATGAYVDMTGCGNTVDFGTGAAVKLVLDSLKYWVDEVQIDGFRFDLAATLGRDHRGHFDPQHPLLMAIADDPAFAGVKMIAEPWDLGDHGWQTGSFPAGFGEWNDRYRNAVRDFWLADIGHARHGDARNGVGDLAGYLTGSESLFGKERGPLASINFVTAHDGFTLADLTAYNNKHNVGNGEDNRDGTNDNRSFNHGVEGPSTDAALLATRRKAMRNLLGTLLFSAGVPMLTAGDEMGRSQRGNNNPYCRDSELTWLNWELAPWQDELRALTARLLQLRRENRALTPTRFGHDGHEGDDGFGAGASHMDWFNANGHTMSDHDWHSPANRTLQYLATSDLPGEANRILLVVHGVERDTQVTLPNAAGVAAYELLWDSAVDGATHPAMAAPGESAEITATSMRLYRAL